MMSLYEINQAIQACFDEEGNVIDADALEYWRNEETGALGRWIINLRAESQAYKDRAALFTERKKAVDNKIENLERRLSERLQGRKYKDFDVQISWRRSQSVEVSDVEALPEEFVVTETTSRPDKAKLKEALKLGEIIEGARLIENNNIQIK